MTDAKLPPQNLKAEQSVLGSQILDARKIDSVSEIITPADFYADVNGKIQKALNKLRAAGAEIDVVVLANQLDSTGDFKDIGGDSYLFQLMESVPHAEHAEYYAQIVKDHARRRQQIKVAQRLMEAAYDSTADHDEIASVAIKAADELAQTQKSGSLLVMSEVVNRFIGDLEKGVSPTVRVMIPEVDQAIGGACPGEMIVLAGRPSHGKSLVALQSLDFAAANGWPGLVISEEMLALSLASRTVSSITTIPSDEWMKSTDRLRFDAREHFADRAKVVIAENCRTASGAEKAIASAVRQYGVRIVAVDYAQLLKGDGDSEHERIGDVSQRMKAMALKHNLIVILLSQMNRGIEAREDPTPTLADLRGSGSLEQDADIVLFSIWPWQFTKNSATPYHDPLEYRIYQAKNRSRGIGSAVIQMRINPARQRIETAGPSWD